MTAQGFDYKSVRAFLRKKQEKQDAENHRRFQRAWADFERIVALIIQKYRPFRIYQWGSLLNARHFCPISDIDIALEGVESAEQYFQILGDAMELTDFPLDIVEMEKIDPLHAQSIREKGRLVYERRCDHSGAAGRNP